MEQDQLPAASRPGEIALRQPPAAPSPAAFVEIRAPRSEQPLNEQDTGGLVDYWRILRRRKGTVILISFFGALVGLLITLPQTPIYQAKATIEIQDLNPDFMSLNLRQQDPVSTYMGSGGIDMETQIKLLKSGSLVEGVIAKLKMKQPGEIAGTGRISAWRKALSLPEKPQVEARAQALGMAAGTLNARASGQSRIVEISCDSTEPGMASTFVNTTANEFIDRNIEARWKMTQYTGEWLGHQLEEMRIKLERSEDSLQAYARQSGLMFTSEKTNVSEEKLHQLQTELSSAQADRIGKQSRWEIANSSPVDTLADIVNDTSLREYQTKLTDLRRQLAELSATYTPEYAKVKRVKSQITELESALEKERSAILKRIKNDYEESQRRESLLAENYATQSALVTQEAGKSVQYNILKREVESNRQLYDTMLQKLKEATISSAMRASNIRVVDAAKPPSSPYKPDLSHNSGLGFLAGLFLGVAFVIVRERADRSIQEPGDSGFYLNVTELGVIPSGHQTPLAYARARNKLSRKANYASIVENADGGQPAASTAVSKLPDRFELITWQRKPSIQAEAFRSTLTSILFSDKKGDRPRILVITSSDASEGKSSVCSNLGVALADVKQKVLLIDGDLRKPRLHEIFGFPNHRGLTELLQNGKGEIDLSSGGWLQETEIPNLFVLPAGTGTLNSANMLYGPHVPALIRRFAKEFDMVLIDSPPALQIPDARVWSRMADAVILVVRADRTTRDAAMAACHRLKQDGARILGTILNDWDPRLHRHSYYGYYKGYYYSKSYRKNYTQKNG